MDLRGMMKVGLPWSMVVSSIVVSSSFFSLAFCFSPNCSSRIAICSAVGLDTFSYTYMYNVRVRWFCTLYITSLFIGVARWIQTLLTKTQPVAYDTHVYNMSNVHAYIHVHVHFTLYMCL